MKTVNKLTKDAVKIINNTARYGEFYVPTERVINTPGFYSPKVGRVYETQSRNYPFLCERYINTGDDGHTEYEQEGYYYFETEKEMCKTMNEDLHGYKPLFSIIWR